jgi:hypothetical protein
LQEEEEMPRKKPNYDFAGAQDRWNANPGRTAGELQLTLSQANGVFWDFEATNTQSGKVAFAGHITVHSMDNDHHITLVHGSHTGKKANYHFSFYSEKQGIDGNDSGDSSMSGQGHYLLNQLPNKLMTLIKPVLDQVFLNYRY